MLHHLIKCIREDSYCTEAERFVFQAAINILDQRNKELAAKVEALEQKVQSLQPTPNPGQHSQGIQQNHNRGGRGDRWHGPFYPPLPHG